MMDFSIYDKPWPEAICKLRYCNGQRITLEALAQLSGVPFDKLKNWSSSDNWVIDRRRFQAQLNAQVEEKVSKTLSETLSDEISSILLDHWQSAHRGRSLVDARLEAELQAVERIQEAIQSGEASEQDLLTHLRSLPARDQQHLATALQKLLQSERESLGMGNFLNLELTIRALHDLGYAVLNRDEYEQMITDEPQLLPENITE